MDKTFNGVQVTQPPILPDTPDLSNGYNADDWQKVLDGGNVYPGKFPDFFKPADGDTSTPSGGGGSSTPTVDVEPDNDTDEPDAPNPPSGSDNLDPMGDPLSPDSLDVIKKTLDDLYNLLFGGDKSTTTDMINNLSELFTTLQHNLNDILGKDNYLGWEKVDIKNLSQTMFNFMSSWITAQYNNAYNLSSWIAQQQYNSPINQVSRLLDAGINPVWYFGSLNSGNAANAPAESSVQPSEGQFDAVNSRQQKWDRALGLLDTAGSITSAIFGAYGQAAGAVKSLADASYSDAQAKGFAGRNAAQTAAFWASAANQDQAAQGQKITNKYLGDKMASNIAMFNAQTESYRANAAETWKNLDFIERKFNLEKLSVEEGLRLKSEELKLNDKISRRQCFNNFEIARMGAETQRYLGNLSFAGGNLQSLLQSGQGFTDVEQYVDEETGEVISSEQAANMSLQAKVRGGKTGIGSQNYFESSETGRTYKKVMAHVPFNFNFSMVMPMISELQTSLEYGHINSNQFSRGMERIARMCDSREKMISNHLGSYVASSMLNTIFDPSKMDKFGSAGIFDMPQSMYTDQFGRSADIPFKQ